MRFIRYLFQIIGVTLIIAICSFVWPAIAAMLLLSTTPLMEEVEGHTTAIIGYLVVTVAAFATWIWFYVDFLQGLPLFGG